eukprot:Selendium_serpulae@DN5258_c0_g1_i1.p1
MESLGMPVGATWLNFAVGASALYCVVSRFLPAFTQSQSAKATNVNVRGSVRDGVLAILWPWTFFSWPLGPLFAIPFMVLLWKCAAIYGMSCVGLWYFAPYLVCNLWLVTYNRLLAEAHDSATTHEWIGRNLKSHQRSLLLSPLLWASDHLHHHLRHLNALQTIDFSVPHYHAREALAEIYKLYNTETVRKLTQRGVATLMTCLDGEADSATAVTRLAAAM